MSSSARKPDWAATAVPAVERRARGEAAPGRWKLIPIAFPVALALGAIVREGPDAAMLLRLLVALLLASAGIALGALIDSRGRRGEHPRYA